MGGAMMTVGVVGMVGVYIYDSKRPRRCGKCGRVVRIGERHICPR
jgi:hypothetical protein